MTPRQYDLLLTRSQKLVVALPLIMLIVFPILFLSTFGPGFSAGEPESGIPLIFRAFPLLIFTGVAMFYLWSLLSLPYRISVTHDQQIIFKSVLKSRSVRAPELVSIEPCGLPIQANMSGYMLKHQNGKIRFPGQFTEQYMLLHEMKQANPMLIIRGC